MGTRLSFVLFTIELEKDEDEDETEEEEELEEEEQHLLIAWASSRGLLLE